MGRRKPAESAAAAGGGGSASASSELFICFTGREPHPPSAPSLSASRSRRRSGSLKSGAHSPMFSSAAAAAAPRRRGSSSAGFDAEPSSPKVTCIGQVRVKGGKRRPKSKKPPLPPGSAAVRSRSRREASFRHDRGHQQGWVYQIPVSICEAVKAVVPCSGGKSLCGSRSVEDDGFGKKRNLRGGGCGGAISRWLVAVDNDEEEDGEDADAAVQSCEKAKVGMVMAGWEEREMAGGAEIVKEMRREVFVISKEEDEEEVEEKPRVSVCVPPPNALLLMRCRSDPVRMAALATRFWGSPAAAAAPVDKGRSLDNSDDEVEDQRAEAVQQEDGDDEDEATVASADKVLASAEVIGADKDLMDVDEGSKDPILVAAAEPSSEAGLGAVNEKVMYESESLRDDDDHGCSITATVTDRSTALEVIESSEIEAEIQMDEKDDKGDREFTKCRNSPSVVKDGWKLSRSGSLHGMRVRRCSSAREKGAHRHSFSNERESRRPSFSNQKDARRASFSIERNHRWSFSIEGNRLVADLGFPSEDRKTNKCAETNELEEGSKGATAEMSASQDDRAPLSEDLLSDQKSEPVEKLKDVNLGEGQEEKEEVKDVAEKTQGKKSGELPDCLLLMMYEPKLSMEVSKETWVCSTDFVQWQSYQGAHRRGQQVKAGGGSEAAKPKASTDSESDTIANADANGTDAGAKSQKVSAYNAAAPAKPPPPVATPQPKTVTIEQKLILELPVVANSAYAPFVLKRCKSEPRRSSALLAPDACFWKERHRPIGATGIGF